METPAVAVAIVNWNSARDTLALVARLDELYPELAVVVVDNDSSDDDSRLLAAGDLSCDVLKSGSNLGYGGGMNIAIRFLAETGATHAWLFNPDARPTPGSLEALTAHLDQAVALSPRQAISVDPVDTYCSAAFKDSFKVSRFTCTGCDLGVHEVDVVTGTGLLVDIAQFERVGGFDESYFHYKEEFDLVDRMAQSGSVRLVCSSLVVHERGGSLAHHSPRATYYEVRNELLYVSRAQAPSHRKVRQKLRWTARSLLGLVSTTLDRGDAAKRERLRLAAGALVDGWRGRGGRL